MAVGLEDITKILEQARAEIRANIVSKGIKASGRSMDAFKVRNTRNGVQLYYAGGNVAPLETLEIGRPAGNVPGGFARICRTGKYAGRPDVSNTFKYILIKWAEEKGLADFGWGAATNLGRKIAYEGTDRQRAPQDVYSTTAVKAANDIRNLVPYVLRHNISEIIKTNF